MSRELKVFEQNDANISASIEEIRKIQQMAADLHLDPLDRLAFYMDYLYDNYKYDDSAVNKFYEYIREKNAGSFKYADYMNMCKFFLKKEGACQQFAIGLSMLCYDDPEIECYQMVVEKGKKKRARPLDVDRYKHSVNYVNIPSMGVHGIVDTVSLVTFPDVTSPGEYIRTTLRGYEHIKLLGMAYYVPGLDLKSTFISMQGFGSGIKFDFDSFFSGTKTFMESYDQDRLEKFRQYQIENNANLHKKR